MPNKPQRKSPGCEALETRLLLSTGSWTSTAGGPWHASANRGGGGTAVALPAYPATPTGVASAAAGLAADLGTFTAASDVGSPGQAGSTQYAGGVYTVRGSGADVWGTSDQFHFASRALIGDGAIIARVQSVSNTGTYAKAGLMIRDGTAANARYAYVFVMPAQGAGFEYRAAPGATSASAGTAAAAAPAWLQIARSGDTFSALTSADGATWTRVGAPVTIAMGGVAQVGLAVDANTNAALNTATFTDVSVGAYSTVPQAANLARFQVATADTSAGGRDARYATDGFVGDAGAWQAAGASAHWLAVALPAASTIGSAQLHLGQAGAEIPTDFRIQFLGAGGAWADVPGTSVSGNAASVVNLVFSSPVTASRFRLYTPNPNVTVRELALFAPQGPAGFAAGAGVTANVARQATVTASSATAGRVALNAVDGYAGDAAHAWQPAAAGTAYLTVDLGQAATLGGVHLYSGSESAPALSDFRVQYWTGSAWADAPGGVVAGNVDRNRAVDFASAITTARLLLVLPDTGAARAVREFVALAAPSTPASRLPLGTGVTLANPPATNYETVTDNYFTVTSAATGAAIAAGGAGGIVLSASGPSSFQFLYNYESDTYRIVDRATGLALTAQGAAVAEAAYSAEPYQQWRLADAGNGRRRIVNAFSGLALQAGGGAPAVISAAPAFDGAAAQQWLLNFAGVFPKKGGASNASANLGASFLYNWSPGGAPPASAGEFWPMQFAGGDTSALAGGYVDGQRDGGNKLLLGFNEPDISAGAAGGSEMTVAQAIAAWPKLMAMNLPLVSPATSSPNDWLRSFYAQAAAAGYRVDFTATHWYGNPNVDALLSTLEAAHAVANKPVYLTEFGNANYENRAYSEEDNFKFLAEFMWAAETLPWLKGYAAFPFAGDEAAAPWVNDSPLGYLYKSDQATLTALGRLYKAWDGDIAVRANKAYNLWNAGSSHFMTGNGGAAAPGAASIFASGPDTQWELAAAPAAGRYYLVSLKDGRRLSYDGSSLGFAAAGTIGARVEWTQTPDAKGYVFLNSGSTGRRLALNRADNADGSPAGLWFTMENGTAATDATRWRFQAPYEPVAIAGVADGGFEAPLVGAANFEYRPPNGRWTFAGRAGVAADGSAFGAPAAAGGTQAAFLQSSNGAGDAGRVSQRVMIEQAGRYTVWFATAARAFGGVGQRVGVYLDGALLGTVTPSSTSAWAPAGLYLGTVAAGTHTLAFAALSDVGDQSAFLDSIVLGAAPAPPAVASAAFTFAPAVDALTVRFTGDVGGSLSASDLVIRSVADGQTLDTSGTLLKYDAQSNTATFTFPGVGGGTLPDGVWRATLGAAGVADASGQALDGNGDAAPGDDWAFDFFALAGDANRDRRVDFNDLVPLAQNYNVSDGRRTWADGDFTGDGTVDFNDLIVLAQRYNTALPGAAPVTAPAVQFDAAMAAAFAAAGPPVASPKPPSAPPPPPPPPPPPAPVAGRKPPVLVAVRPASVVKPPAPLRTPTAGPSSKSVAAEAQAAQVAPASPATLPASTAFGTTRIKAAKKAAPLW